MVSLDKTVEVNIPASGFFEIPLVIPDDGTPYFYEMEWVDEDEASWKLKGKILVPNSATALINNIIL